jgi:DNA-binding MarR family transcriptional regulator
MRFNLETRRSETQSEMRSSLDAALGTFVRQASRAGSQVAAATSFHMGVPFSAAALNLLDQLRIRPMRPTELAACVGIKPSSLTKQVQELEAKGLIVRTIDEKDGRAAIIRLTHLGHECVAAAGEVRQSVLAQFTDGWSDEQIQDVIDLLDKLASVVQTGVQEYWGSRSSSRQLSAADGGAELESLAGNRSARP